ncbi:hypothetical protein KW850_32340 [Bacillus sp. sid0103]|uniref:DUF5412 family protein n=1 Tax=Bacillus sp. sid0103 TaxID=2856337 RepID=UPI001C459173|nr:DUF5412 family protein [Bacillus sp. sid0103]MBV7509769.1 hypothetical protein [Bacillus sp. sid0103]
MTKRYKTFLITIITIIILFMAGKYLLNFLFEDLCGNDIKQKIPSPNGENIAYIFDRSCGATTGFSPQLSILYKDDELENESGNTFGSEKDFSIEWLDEKNLKVTYDISSETYEMKKKVNGITIEYIGK